MLQILKYLKPCGYHIVIVNFGTYATYSVFKKTVDLKFAVFSEYSAHGSRHDLLPLRIF